MHVAEQKFAAFLRSRPATLLMILTGVAMTVAAPYLGLIPDVPPEGSALVSLPFSLDVPSWGSALLLIAVMAAMYHINRRYNMLRTTRIVYAGVFMVMCGAAPAPASEAVLSALLALVMLSATSLYFLLYNRPRDRRKIFLAGVMLGCTVLLHRAAVLYLPVLIIGLTQMRVFNSRALAALIIGVLTPAWIIWAIFDADFNFHISVWNTHIFDFILSPDMWCPLAVVIITLLAGLIMGLMVLIKVFTLNARLRALNGFIAIMAVATGIFTIIDYENIYFYVTLLDALVAFQAAHFFRLNRHRSGYLSLTLLILAYIAIYLCPLIL